MLAEKISSTELMLPKMLQDKAVVLAGEFSWPASDALQVVDWLAANDSEVVGVEFWRNKEGKPLFAASSDYSPSINDEATPESIAWCAHKAKQFITKFSHEQEALFNIIFAQPSANSNNVTTASALSLHSRVRLLMDKYQSEGASCFDVGYIIEVYPDNKYEVEFSNLDGITTAQIVADGNELQFAPPTFAAPQPNPNAPQLSANTVKEHNP